jgi:PAS domain S-box-containing protein
MFSILYVDDEPGLLEIGKLFLEQGGQFSVETLTSADEALGILRSRQFDAIISDYQMPVMNGIEFLKRVRASGNTIPFIIFTGRGREEIVIQALNEGADFYLQKGGEPVSQFTELSHKIRQAVQQRRAEASISDHERREADIINFLPDATFAIDTNGVVIAWNRAMEKMTGVPSSDILGKGDHEYAIPFYHERRPILIDLVLKDDPETAGKYPAITRDGTTLFSEITIPHLNNGNGAALWFTASPLFDRQGTIIGAIESIREITGRKRAEEALNESEKFLNSVVENIPDMIFVKDAKDLRFLRFNKAGEELLGYSRENLYGKSDHDFFPRDDADFFTKNDRMVLDNRKAVDIPEEKVRTRFRGERILHTKKIPILDETGTPVYLLGISEDITERMRADSELRDSVAFLNSLIDQSPTPMWISDETGTLIRINRACCELLKTTEDEVIGKYSLFDDNIVQEQGFLPRVRDVFTRGIVAQFQLAYDTTTLTTIPLEKRVSLFLDVTIFPIRDSRGKITNAVIQHADITRRRKTEAALRESEQKYRTVFETTGTATVLIENNGTISLANTEFARLSGYGKDEIENRKKWTEFVVQEDLDRMLAQHQLRRQDPTNALPHYEFRFRIRSGEIRDIYLTIDVIPGTDRSVASLLDITERKRAESSLITANQEYTNLLDQIQDVYYRSDSDGRLVKASRSLATLLGYDDISECIGRNIADDFYMVPADRKPFLEEIYRSGKVTNYEVRLKKKDGTSVLVSTSTHVNVDATGKALGVEGTFRDITERKRQEHILRTQLDLGLALQTTHGMRETLDVCLKAATEISGTDAGGIYLVDEKTGSVDLLVSRNLTGEFVANASHYPADSANARIIRAGRPLYVPYNELGVTHTPDQVWEGLRASAVIPISSGRKVTACLNITSHILWEIPQAARVALETIAIQIGAAIERVRADQELQESEQRYRNVVEDQTEFITRFLPDGMHVFVNDAYCRYFGLKREEILGHRFRPEFPPEDRKRMDLFFKTLTPDHPVDIIEHRIIMPDGSIRWQRWSDRAIFDPAENITEYQSVGRDVTVMKETEEALRASERQFRLLAENSQDVIERHSADARCIYISPACRTLLGYDPEELIGHYATEILHPEDIPVIAGYRKSVSRNNPSAKVSFRIRHRDGHFIWFESVFRGLFDEKSGELMEIFSINRDITERRKAEEQLEESRERFQTIFRDSPLGIAIVSPDFTFRMVNRQFCGMLKYSEDELLTKSFADITHPDHLTPDITESRKIFTGEREVYKTEKRYIKKDGSILWASLTASPVKDGAGRVLYTIALIEDITERRDAEDALRQKTGDLDSRNRLISTLLETVPIGIFMVEAHSGKPIIANREAARLLGRGILPDATEENLAEVYEAYQAATSQRYPTEEMPVIRGMHGESRHIDDMVVVRPDGTRVQLEIFGTPVFDSQGRVTASLVSFLDITDRKRAEVALRVAQEKYTKAFHAVQDAMTISELDSGKFIEVNEAATVLFGYSREELMGRSAVELGIWLNKEDRAAFMDQLKKNGRIKEYEVIEKRKSGELYTAVINADTLTIGNRNYLISVIRDITNRNRAEQVIREANRKINLLTSITRHDVANQISVLRGYTRLALMKKPDPAVTGLLEKMDEAISTIARQVAFTKAYQELGVQAPGWQKIRDIVAQQNTDGISLSCTCDAEVFADPMLERVFYNLIENAVRHGEKVTGITISCRERHDDLVIVVADDGVGVPHNLKEKIFEKGYGTHTGFGLFLAREILAITGIGIRETGTYRKGAQFEITVPKGTYRTVS